MQIRAPIHTHVYRTPKHNGAYKVNGPIANCWWCPISEVSRFAPSRIDIHTTSIFSQVPIIAPTRTARNAHMKLQHPIRAQWHVWCCIRHDYDVRPFGRRVFCRQGSALKVDMLAKPLSNQSTINRLCMSSVGFASCFQMFKTFV